MRNQERAHAEISEAFIVPSFLGHMIIIKATELVVFLVTPRHCLRTRCCIRKGRGWKVLGEDTAFGTVHTILRLIKDGWEVFRGEQ